MSRKVISATDTQSLSLTIYNGGFGAVKELRQFALNGDEREIVYADVAQRIEIDSLLVEGLEILEFNYDYDLVSKQKLLQKYIGREIYLKERETGSQKICRILSVEPDGKCVLEDLETREIYVDTKSELVLPSLPSGLLMKPALVWKIVPSKADAVKVSYLSKGFTWEANYVIELENESLNIAGWAKIENNSGSTFENAKIKLIAGEVNRIEEADDYGSKFEIRSLAMDSSPQAEEKAFFDYHLYTLTHPTTLKNEQTKQICLLSGENVPFKKYYRLESREEESEVILEIFNEKEAGLGIPLPAGKVKVYQVDDADDSLEFVGEDEIDHTPKDERLELTIGKAFDVTYEFVEKDKRKSGGYDYYLCECTIRNHKEASAEVRLEHRIWGAWEIISASHDYTKQSSDLVEFVMTVPAEGVTIVTFEYRIDRRLEIELK